MNEILRAFSYGEKPVRVTEEDGQVFFVAKDVCEVLGLVKPDRATASLEDDQKGTHTVSTPGGTQQMTTINESGLYALVFKSRKPEAKAFQRWVTSEVLPAIRRSGSFSIRPVENSGLAQVEASLAATNELLNRVTSQFGEMMGMVAQKVMAQDQKIEEVRSEVADVKLIIETARDASHGEAAVEAPGTLRDDVVALVSDYAVLTGRSHRDAWHRVYNHFERKMHVKLDSRKRGKENKIDCVERLGWMDELHAVVLQLMKRAQAA